MPAYRAFLAQRTHAKELAAFRSYLQQQRAYGRDAFQALVEARTKRFAGVRPARRPTRAARSPG